MTTAPESPGTAPSPHPLPFSRAETDALIRLLRNAVMDTGCNAAAALYGSLLTRLGPGSAYPPRRHFLDVSSTHLTPADRAFLALSSRYWDHDAVAAMQGCYGWFVYAHDDRPSMTVSNTLWRILCKARELDCDYVLFDEAGPEHDDLPLFDTKQ